MKPLLDINATDRDKGNNSIITYSITEDSNNVFSINASTGVIVLRSTVDREATDMTLDSSGFGVLTLIVTAADNGVPSKSSNVKVMCFFSLDFVMKYDNTDYDAMFRTYYICYSSSFM